MTMREKLIELLREGIPVSTGGVLPVAVRMTIYGAEKLADHLIANGVTIQTADKPTAVDYNLSPTEKWIPVTERLPEEEELVLILCKNGARFVGYCGKQYCDFGRRWRIKTALNSTKLLNLGRVTHWMPLPPAPGDLK